MEVITPSDAPLQNVTFLGVAEWNAMAETTKEEGENDHMFFTTTGRRLLEVDGENETQYAFNAFDGAVPVQGIPRNEFIMTADFDSLLAHSYTPLHLALDLNWWVCPRYNNKLSKNLSIYVNIPGEGERVRLNASLPKKSTDRLCVLRFAFILFQTL